MLKSISYPCKSKAIYGIGKHVTEQRRERVECRKVSVHVRTLPVRYARHDDALDVVEDGGPLLALGGRCFGQQIAHVSGLNIRKDAAISDGLQIVGNVVNHLLP